jgi:iron complex outermembrane receptor protein
MQKMTKLLFLSALGLLAFQSLAQVPEKIQEIDQVFVRGGKTNVYFKDSNAVVAKIPLKSLENAQVYQSIPKQLIQDQLATELNDVLKNATGVIRLWESTGRGGDGAEFYTMRGFSVQPTMINGVPAYNSGVLDPANTESVEVIKGPSGALFGSPMISYGGLVNITTKKPYDIKGGQFSYLMGSFGQNRITADYNTPISENAAVRLNAAFNEQGSFQDAGFRKTIFLAPSLKLKASDKLTFWINTEFQSAKSANAPMLFLSRYAPLSFTSIETFAPYYERSFTSNELSIENPAYAFQTQGIYQINKNWKSQTIVTRSSAKTKGYYHYLWDFSDGNTFGRYISKRSGETRMTDIQQNFIGDVQFGAMRHRILIGLDAYESNILNASTGWVANGLVSMSTGTDSGILTQVGVDSLLVSSSEGVSTASNRVLSTYFGDVINLTSQLSVSATLRIDRFSGLTNYWSTQEVKSQFAVSPKFGLVYQPVKDKVAIFANYMNGFLNQAPVQVADADGSNVRMQILRPEQANQTELGLKTELFKNRMALSVSAYHIQVSDKVMTDPTNVNGMIQGGEVVSKGIELSLVANPVKGLNLIAGYSNNHAEVTKDAPENGYLGLRPEEAGPRQLLNYWLSYSLIEGKAKGLTLGFGGNAASEHFTLNRSNTGTFTLPSFHVLNASVAYKAEHYTLTLRADNLLNTRYYNGWSTITAQQLRAITLGLNFRF